MDEERLVQPNEDWQEAGWTADAFDWIEQDWLEYLGDVLNDFFDYMDEGGYFG